jgi:glucokinase
VILAGDTGGTSTRLALFELREGVLHRVVSEVVRSREAGSLEEAVTRFSARHRGEVTEACFGIPGPVRDGRAEALNLPWVVEARALARALGLQHVWLINDLEANAYGIAALEPGDLAVLNAGTPDPSGNMAVISAGTGLGEAGLAWDGQRHTPFPSEGGHADFAPADELQIELLRFLMAEHGHVSVERVLSGPGLHNIYRFLRDTGRSEEPPWLREEVTRGDAPALISRLGLEGRDPLCVRALDLFVAVYGAEAGNLSLKVMATRGVYLGGGIAPKIIERLRKPGFMEAFVAKGRMRALLEAVPVRVILNDQAALLGAARCAAIRAALL